MELDRYLARDYGIDPNAISPLPPGEGPGVRANFAAWRASHQPFHWFAEFYGVMREGGFDVVIGNPPYVEMAKIRSIYTIHQVSKDCGNLYAPVVERSLQIKSEKGFIGMIVPLSLVATERMRALRELVSRGTSWLASFDMRPGSLFEGIAQRLTILVLRAESNTEVHAGGYRRWAGDARQSLFATTAYAKLINKPGGDILFKASSEQDVRILKKLGNLPLDLHRDGSSQPIYVHRISRYFIKAFDFVPHFRNSSGEIGRSEDYKPFQFAAQQVPLIAGYLNTSTFYWFWRGISDGFHCGYGDVFRAPYKVLVDSNIQEKIVALTNQLFSSLKCHSKIKQIRSAKGVIEYQEFYPSKSKEIADKIDVLIGESWGFDLEELDYLINYDIKYRMGGADDEE